MSHCMTKQLARETKKPFFDLAATLYQSTGVSCIITENSAERGAQAVQQAGWAATPPADTSQAMVYLGPPLKAVLGVHGSNCFKMETIGFFFFLFLNFISVLASCSRICFLTKYPRYFSFRRSSAPGRKHRVRLVHSRADGCRHHS